MNKKDFTHVFSIDSKVLLRSLLDVSPIIRRDPVLPILENVLFVCERAKLKITASDLHTFITKRIESAETHIGVFGFCIDTKRLIRLLRLLPVQPLRFSIDTGRVLIETETGRYYFASERPTDYPKQQVFSTLNHATVDVSVLRDAFAKTYPFTATNDLRPAMNVVLIHPNGDVVGTDGWRLSIVKTDLSLRAPLLVPKAAVQLFLSAFAKYEGNIDIDENSHRIVFMGDGICITTHLLNEKYPSYELALPTTEQPTQVVVSRSGLNSTLKRMAIFTNKQMGEVCLSVYEQTMLVDNNQSLLYPEDDIVTERIVCRVASKPSLVGQLPYIRIGFNAKLLLEILKTISTTHVLFGIDKANRGALIQPYDGQVQQDHKVLLMPVVTGNDGTADSDSFEAFVEKWNSLHPEAI